jgi:hypothetical protein
MRLVVVGRYVRFVVGIGAWLFLLSAVSRAHPVAPWAFVGLSVAVYWYRRWRLPSALSRTGTGIAIRAHTQPTVVEFYADL